MLHKVHSARLIEQLVRALQYTEDRGRIPRHHYCNEAVRETLREAEDPPEVASGIIELHSMVEDSDVEGHAAALAYADLLEYLTPGEWVLIDTGDYIMCPTLTAITRAGCNVLAQRHRAGDCQETYDPYYRLIIMHRTVFDVLRHKLDKLDRNWRRLAEYRACVPEEEHANTKDASV